MKSLPRKKNTRNNYKLRIKKDAFGCEKLRRIVIDKLKKFRLPFFKIILDRALKKVNRSTISFVYSVVEFYRKELISNITYILDV